MRQPLNASKVFSSMTVFDLLTDTITQVVISLFPSISLTSLVDDVSIKPTYQRKSFLRQGERLSEEGIPWIVPPWNSPAELHVDRIIGYFRSGDECRLRTGRPHWFPQRDVFVGQKPRFRHSVAARFLAEDRRRNDL